MSDSIPIQLGRRKRARRSRTDYKPKNSNENSIHQSKRGHQNVACCRLLGRRKLLLGHDAVFKDNQNKEKRARHHVSDAWCGACRGVSLRLRVAELYNFIQFAAPIHVRAIPRTRQSMSRMKLPATSLRRQTCMQRL